MTRVSPIAAKQRALMGSAHPLTMARNVQIAARGGRFGYLGGPASGAASSAAKGASAGATIGSVVPLLGTAIGAIGGAIGGAMASLLSSRKDPENANFDQAVAMWQANRLSVLNIANKYLVLAGLFDLNIKTNIPIYKRYGHMGEQKFVTDMMTLIYNAAQAGKITPSDTPQTIMVNVVQPWIDSWGFGPMADPHGDLINLILMGMIADYVAGNQTSWKAIGGQYPFASLPPFKLGGQVASTAASYAANAAVATAPVSAVTTQPASNPVATTLTADGSVATPTSNTAVRNNQGVVFSLGSAPVQGGYPILVNGAGLINPAANLPYAGVSVALFNGGTLYTQDSSGAWWQWNGSTFTKLSGTPQQNASTASSAAVAQPAVTPTASGPPTTLAAPTTVLTADGSSATPTSNTALQNNQGLTFWLGNVSVPGGYPIYMNGSIQGNSAAVSLGLLNGGTLYTQDGTGAFWQWTGNTFTKLSAPPVQNVATTNTATSTALSTTPSSTTVPIPAGYSLVGTANGMNAYQGADGNLYSWNGVAMSPLTGTLTTSGGVQYTIISGVIQQTASLTQAAQQLQNTATAPVATYYPPAAAPTASAPYGVDPTTGLPLPAPATTVTAAGVDTSGLPSWLTWGAVAAAAYFMFATARPIKGKHGQKHKGMAPLG